MLFERLRFYITHFEELIMSNLDLKKVQVDELRKVVDESLSVVAVDYRGTDVPKLTSFRKDANCLLYTSDAAAT